MDSAIVWYKSRRLWGMVATLIFAALGLFKIVPSQFTHDDLVNFLVIAAPIVVTIWQTVTAKSQIVGTQAVASAINAHPLVQAARADITAVVAAVKAGDPSPRIQATLDTMPLSEDHPYMSAGTGLDTPRESPLTKA